MPARYAVYWAPPRDGPLDRFGRAWLGRDAETGEPVAPLPAAGLAADRQREMTAEPRHYGFHATLKPPFALAPGATPEALIAATTAFAAARRPFTAPPLMLRRLGGFLALVPSRPCPPLDALAADCVRSFDPFRAPPPPAELDRRRRAGLTPRQERHLLDWGYPYVMEDFRFHLTLTGRLDEAEGRAALRALRPLVAPLCTASLAIGEICLFRQPDRAAPFCLMRRLSFGNAP